MEKEGDGRTLVEFEVEGMWRWRKVWRRYMEKEEKV